MKKLITAIAFVLVCAGLGYVAQTTVNTSSDTFKTAWDRQQAMNTETYGFESSEQTWRSSVTQTEMSYLGGVTSDIQTQFGAKQSTLVNEAGLYAALSDVTDFVQPGDSPSFAALTVESNTIDFGDVTEDYVLTFNASTNTWAGEAAGSGAGDLLANGTVPLTANWDIGAYTITGTRFISDIAIGTAPFGVTSTTLVSNLNSDLLDGVEGSGYQTVLTNSAGLRGALSDETGTGVAVFATSPTLVTPTLGVATATSLSIDATTSGGQLTYWLEDSDNGSNYIGWGSPATVSNDLILFPPATADPLAGQIMKFAAPSSVAGSDGTSRDSAQATWQYPNAIVVKATATTYTIGTTDPQEAYGGIIYVTGACTVTIPAVAAGMNFTVITIGAIAVSVDPNASDLLILDGTTLDDGDKATNTSTTGDIAVFTYYDATGFYVTSNSWTDGS